MASIASLDFILNMNTANWNSGLTAAEARAQRFNSRVNTSVRRVGDSFRRLRGAVVGALAVLGAGQALQAIDTQLKLSQAANISFESFQRLSTAFALAGVTNEQFTRGLVTLSDRINQLDRGSATLVDTFGQLNLSAEDFTDNQSQNLLTVLDALRGITDGAQRAALSVSIFGNRLAVGLGPILQTTNEDLMAIGDSISVIGDSDARSIEAFNDTLAELGRSVTRLLSQFAPFFQVLSNVGNAVTRIFDEVEGLATVVGVTLVGVIANRFLPIASLLTRALTLNTSAFFLNTFRALGYGQSLNTLSFSTRRALLINRPFVASLVGTRASFLGVRLAAVGARVGILAFRAAITLATGGLNLLITGVLLAGITVLTDFQNGWRRVANVMIGTINTISRVSNAVLGTSFRIIELYEITEDLTTGLVDVNDAATDVTNTFLELPEVLDDVADGADMVTDSFTSFIDSANNDFEQFSSLAQNTFNAATDSILNFFETGSLNLRSFVADFIRGFARIRIQQALLGAFGGGTSNFLSGLSGAPARQFGGPVTAGQAYVVGERGPELFVPNSGGSVVSNSNLGGGGGNVTYNINATDARSFQQLVASDPSFIFNVTERGRRQVGV